MDSYEKKHLFWTRITALATVCILIIVLVLAIGASVKFADLQDEFASLQDEFTKMSKMADAMEGMSGHLADVSEKLAQIDWEDLAVNINLTAEKAQQSMDAAMTAIDELDIETLNGAIANLRDVIEPLARFFNTFR